MREETFYDDRNGVVITNARILVPGQMFAMAQVSSVRIAVDPPLRASWILPLTIGASCLFPGLIAGDATLIVVGILFSVAGVYLSDRRRYYVVIATSSGERQALASFDIDHVDRVARAIGEAIVARG